MKVGQGEGGRKKQRCVYAKESVRQKVKERARDGEAETETERARDREEIFKIH